MKVIFAIAIAVFISGVIVWVRNMTPRNHPSTLSISKASTIRYIAIGDSYTIGEGVSKNQSWPALLVEHLHGAGVSIELTANPSRTGWTTQNAIDRELPIFENAKPDFATLLIGVNDWVQGVDATTFRERLGVLMDRMLRVLGSSDKMIAITIPDFSVTPTGKHFGDPVNNSNGIQAFNQIIKEESAKRGIVVVDIFELSQDMGNDPALVAPDGLHPSVEEYKRWEGKIFTEVVKHFPRPQPK